MSVVTYKKAAMLIDIPMLISPRALDQAMSPQIRCGDVEADDFFNSLRFRCINET